MQQADDFGTTRWSLVLGAGRPCSEEAGAALAELCQRYWYPLYAYVRRRVGDVSEAQDLTQEFFARLLEKNTLAAASRERGRFRAFLLGAMKNFLANEWDKAKALKRGGGRPPISLALDTAESKLTLEPAHELTPEKLYERQWALTLLELVVERIEAEYSAAGKEAIFDKLSRWLAAEAKAGDYARESSALGLTEGATAAAVFRLRQRFRQFVREEVGNTVQSPQDIDGEMQHLLATLTRS